MLIFASAIAHLLFPFAINPFRQVEISTSMLLCGLYSKLLVLQIHIFYHIKFFVAELRFSRFINTYLYKPTRVILLYVKFSEICIHFVKIWRFDEFYFFLY